MNKLRRLGNTFYIIATLLWIIPIIVYGFYYSFFVNMQEHELEEKKIANVANIVSSKVEYENNYYIDEEFLRGIEVANDYSIIILNEFGEATYSTNKKFLKVIYSSPEVIEILSGKIKSKKTMDKNTITLYLPVLSKERPVGILIISKTIEESILSKLKNNINMLTLILFLVLAILTFIFARVLTRPITSLRNSVEKVKNGHESEISTGDECYEISNIRNDINHMIYKARILEESRNQFVADVSHELKTPLSSMKVLSDTLLSQSDAPKEMYDEFLRDISLEVDRENKIINDLLTMVSLNNKDSSLHYDLVSINNLIEQIMRVISPIAKEKGVGLQLNSFRNVEAYVDETKFYLALMNLIENAVKYTESSGKVSITLDADYRNFTVKIIDTGIGIASEDVDKIFNRFYRVDKMRSRDSGGTGLGLSIVKQVMLMHGGSIKCHSELGFGTTFILSMPLSKWENSSNLNK